MENFVISVNAILPMFLVMALGYGARCLGWIHREEISDINKVAFRIFLPCLLYYNVYCSDLSGSFDPLLIVYAVGGVLLSFALALGYTLLMEKLPERRGVMIQGMFRSNYVIMGHPRGDGAARRRPARYDLNHDCDRRADFQYAGHHRARGIPRAEAEAAARPWPGL